MSTKRFVGHGLGLALALAAVVVASRGCTNGGAPETERRRSAIGAGADVEAEGNFEEFYQQQYVLPRAFPSSNINSVQRSAAFQQLGNIRSQLGLPHVGAQWLNAAGPQDCTPNCDEGSDCFGGQCFPFCSSGEFPCVGEGVESFSTPDGSCICVPVGGVTAGPPPGLCGWASVGPTNIHGRVTGLSVDPTNDARVFSSSVGGVWRSVDGGRRWQRVSDDIIIGTASLVAINPSVPSEVFAGIGEPDYPGGGGGGLIRSTSGGDPGTWSDVSGTSLANALFFKLVFDPGATNTIYAATNAGVFTGTHTATGITWTQLGASFGSVDDLEIDFGASPPTIYAATEAGDIRKWDGTNWNSRTSGIDTTSAARIALAMSASNTKVLYARVTSTSGFLVGVYRTTTAAEQPEGGVAWNLDSAANAASLNDSSFGNGSGYAWWGNFLVADPRSSDVVYSGGVNLFKRTAAGWTNVSTGTDATFPLGLHGDQHVVVLDPSNPDVVWVGNDGGINRSTPQSAAWHWVSSAHGMVITENYQIATQQNFATLVTGGTQDNGTIVTYGNRTWYPSAGCDGSFVAVDPVNASTVYGSGNCGLYEVTQPVPYVSPGGSSIGIGVPADIANAEVPIVTDPSEAHVALVAGVRKDPASDGGVLSGRALLKTTDGVTWTEILTLASGGFAGMFISPTAGTNGKKTYYVGVNSGPSIFSSQDEGATWNESPTGLPSTLSPNAIAIDWTNPSRAIAGFGGGAGGLVALTTNSGGSWTTLTATAPSILPSSSVTGVAIDPNDPNTIYVSTSVGVFKGVLTPSTNAVAFAPFDEGLPNGLDVNRIWIDKASSLMTIGSMGHGSFQRDITPGVTCPGAFLVARDNVYDRGTTPSLSGAPDPEHPIPDPTRPNFFMPNNTPGGSVYWWDSTDVRIDVPSIDDPAHVIASADNFEFESCPIEVSTGCPAGTMMDSNPVRGKLANAYVQVTNRGLSTASNTRVVALFADATLEVPPLPASFWTTTFPTGSTSCGTLDTSTGWNLVGCATIPVVNPELPEVAQIPWNVPAAAASHSCMLTVVDSNDDPVPDATRGLFDTSVLVPGDRHVAQRNLHVVDGPSTPGAGGAGGGGSGAPEFFFTPGGGIPSTPFHGIVDVLVPNRSGGAATISVIVSPTGLTPDGKIEIMLPPGVSGTATGLPPVCGQTLGTGGTSSAILGFQIPAGVDPAQLTLAANGQLAVGDRVTINEGSIGFGSMSNVGATQTTFGTALKAGSVWSVPSVSLSSNDALSGTLRTSGTVSQQTGVTVAGGITQNVAIPIQTITWTASIPASSHGTVDEEPGHSQTIAPGRYGSVAVKSRGTLRLSAGTYIFDSLDLEPMGTIIVDKSAGQVFIYVQTSLIERGLFADTSGKQTDVFLGYLGTQDAAIGSPFSGMIVAPSAKLTLNTVGSPFTGSFFAKNLQVDPGTTIIHQQFPAFSGLTTCATLDPTETSQAKSLGLSATLFGVPNHEITFTLPMTTGQSIRMGLRYESGQAHVNTSSRFSALLRRGGAIKGGSTFILRFH